MISDPCTLFVVGFYCSLSNHWHKLFNAKCLLYPLLYLVYPLTTHKLSVKNVYSNKYNTVFVWASIEYRQGVTKRCRLSWLTKKPFYMSPNAGVWGGWAGSDNEYSFAPRAQIIFGNLTYEYSLLSSVADATLNLKKWKTTLVLTSSLYSCTNRPVGYPGTGKMANRNLNKAYGF